MAVTSTFYVEGVKNLLGGGTQTIDWDTDSTVKCALATSAYTPSKGAGGHTFWSSVSANEVSGTGYTAGGQAITARTTTAVSSTSPDEVQLDGSDVSWTTATFTARYAIVYKDTGSAATSPLMVIVDFGADESVSAGTFTIQWASDGIGKFTVTSVG